MKQPKSNQMRSPVNDTSLSKPLVTATELLSELTKPVLEPRKNSFKLDSPSNSFSAPQRHKEKFVSLADVSSQLNAQRLRSVDVVEQASSSSSEDHPPGRLAVYCIAESLDRRPLAAALKMNPNTVRSEEYKEVLYSKCRLASVHGSCADIYCFDYGVLVFWGMSEEEEQEVLQTMVTTCEVDPIAVQSREVEIFEYTYTTAGKPHIKDDIIHIHQDEEKDHLTKLAVSFALSQSLKFVVYETLVQQLLKSTSWLPVVLSETGEMQLSSEELTELYGKLYIYKGAVHLVSNILHTPDFFWEVEDCFQFIYDKVYDYLEMDTRINVMNTRFQVLQELLDILRSQEHAAFHSRLEWITIWLCAVCSVCAALSLVGVFKKWLKEH